MQYQGKEIEIVSKKAVFGKQIAEIKILSSGKFKSVPFADLTNNHPQPNAADLIFKAIAAKIQIEVYRQSMLAPLESNIIPLPHQILALEKVMSGQVLRFPVRRRFQPSSNISLQAPACLRKT